MSKEFKFDVDIGTSGSYSRTVESNATKLYDMIEETATKFKNVLKVIADILNWFVVILLIRTVFMAILYRRGYLKKDYKDNYFITPQMKELDRDRDLARKGRNAECCNVSRV